MVEESELQRLKHVNKRLRERLDVYENASHQYEIGKEFELSDGGVDWYKSKLTGVSRETTIYYYNERGDTATHIREIKR